MDDIFSQVLNMSLTSSVVILCVMAVRLLLKRSPKIFSYALWAVVLFRLLCPVSLPSPVSLLELTKPQVTETTGLTSTVSYLPVEYVYTQRQAIPKAEEPVQETVRMDAAPVKAAVTPIAIAAWVWLAGISVMAMYSSVVYIRLRWKLLDAAPYRGEVYLADHIASPFVLGILRPRIYLPSSIPMKERRFIIAHERHHIRRGDHIIKLLAYAALCVHWFNPLVWAAFLLAGKDMEMSCDEAVIRKLGDHIRADYSASLLRLATGHKIISGTPLSFGEGDTKGRVRNMARWKKPKVWVVVVCIAVCIAVLAACAVNPEVDTSEETGIKMESFAVKLPEGFSYETEGDGSLMIFDGSQNVGGLTVRDAPGFPLKMPTDAEWNVEEWVAALGLPEAEDETLAHWIEASAKGPVEVCYWPDVAGNTGKDRTHYLYLDDPLVYDLWFDENYIERDVVNQILGSVELAARPGTASSETLPTEAAPSDAMNQFDFEDREEFNSEDGTVHFQIDLRADDTLPALPMVEVMPDYLSEEDVKQAAHAIFGEDAKFYESEPTMTKNRQLSQSEILAVLDRYAPYTDEYALAEHEGLTKEQMTDEEMEYLGQIAANVEVFLQEYTEKLETAPVENPRPDCQWTYQKESYYFYDRNDPAMQSQNLSKDENAIEARVTVDGIPYKYCAYTYNGSYKSNWIVTYIDDYDDPGYSLGESVLRAQLCRTAEPTQEQVDAIQVKAETMLANMGLGQWMIDRCYVSAAGIRGETAMEYRICVDAVPLLNGVPAVRRGVTDDDSDNYAMTDVNFEFAPGGELISMWLFAPLEIRNVSSESRSSMDMEALLEAAKTYWKGTNSHDYGWSDMIDYMHPEGAEVICNVQITQASCALSRVRVPGTEATYRYVPSLCLMGTADYRDAENGTVYYSSEASRNILILNSIDGSVIAAY